jgi:integrase
MWRMPPHHTCAADTLLKRMDGSWRTGPPTTQGQGITFVLDAETCRVLRRHRKVQLEQRIALGDMWQGDGAVVFTRTDGRPLRPSDVSKAFTTVVRTLGLPPIGVHRLRHSFATLAIRSGVPVHILSRRLGHASVGITLSTYAHARPSDDRDAAERAAAIFGT